MKFDKIPETTFQQLQLGAGVLLRSFTPATGDLKMDDIFGATSGGINFNAAPTYTDYGEDIDNCPKNMMELKKLDRLDVSMSGSFRTINAANVKLLVAAADIDKTDPTKITPRNDITVEDFSDVWWVGDYSDKNSKETGGFVAIHMLNTLSTGGFQIQTGDKAKGQFAFTFTAHYSMAAQEKVPFEVYVKTGT